MLVGQLERGGEVLLNTVGTLGVGAEWQLRLTASRKYLFSRYATTRNMLLADDVHLEAAGPHFRQSLWSSSSCGVVGCPLPLEKTLGRTATTWVGLRSTMVIRQYPRPFFQLRHTVTRWLRQRHYAGSTGLQPQDILFAHLAVVLCQSCVRCFDRNCE